MYELVRSTLHSKLLSSLRLPSFAGNGLPERMRSISFALLGLTAAAGLALVAIFAQPSFPLLSPAPLPAEPSARESIGNARRLPLDHGAVALLTALPAPAPQPKAADATGGAPPAGTSSPNGATGGVSGSEVAPAEAEVPAPVSAPQPSSGSSGGGGGGNGSGSAPSAAPGASTSAGSSPTTSPKPPAPKPEATTSALKSEPAPAPGHSRSAAAAEHASERGIEVSASSGPPANAAASAVPAEPETSPAPGDGNGLAKGHSK